MSIDKHLPPLLSATLSGALLALSLSGVQRPSQEEIEAWSETRYEGVLANALPTTAGVEASDLFDRYDWIVVIQIKGGHFSDQELRMSLRKTFGGKIEGAIWQAWPSSIWHQLMDLASQDLPSWNVAETSQAVKIKKRSIDSDSCVVLTERAAELESLTISPIPPGELMLDAPTYTVVFSRVGEQQITLKLLGPGPKALSQPSPILAWIELLRENLNQCN